MKYAVFEGSNKIAEATNVKQVRQQLTPTAHIRFWDGKRWVKYGSGK